jgi:uncharacterized protein YndB with AHSA1/START domain
MSEPEHVSVTRRIAAPARTIFELITDPRGHVRIDGSGMLVAADNAPRLERVGDAFEMDMDREPLGDIPLGRYRTRNVVTNVVPDEWLEWSVGGVGRNPYGHVYGYRLSAVDDRTTDVTSYCDWSGVPAERKARSSWPVVPLSMLEQSLANLDRLLTSEPQS